MDRRTASLGIALGCIMPRFATAQVGGKVKSRTQHSQPGTVVSFSDLTNKGGRPSPPDPSKTFTFPDKQITSLDGKNNFVLFTDLSSVLVPPSVSDPGYIDFYTVERYQGWRTNFTDWTITLLNSASKPVDIWQLPQIGVQCGQSAEYPIFLKRNLAAGAFSSTVAVTVDCKSYDFVKC
jgi:hypothetical protein